jgi:3-oxoacyl-ACP reductase-like protein
MSIFGKIKDMIFGKSAQAAPAAPPKPVAAPAAPAPVAAAPAPAPAPVPAPEPVDVEAVLEALAAKNPQKLNWRVSIVDLMKLLGMDSSLKERKELADELGFTGDMNDSASMNIWLHKKVLKELAANGGKVPAELLS